ncbi:hypothetical protein C7974DRAFT_75113 [Boeremia exigua]|uniref:uncharacterized protein n=1 Tax=Boeremia exigua TaxID=749465 RepID=UPI001E8E42C6|nr:uncharacterized protein C7974DRAFT_75113 [Boeremia exigua]KAH6613033.1 hypothetical protein C7974DRAFT_75113 [Boeremia exigua]
MMRRVIGKENKIQTALDRLDELVQTEDSLFVKTISDDSTGPVIIVIDGVDEATPENQELIVKLAKQLSDLKFSAKHKPGIQLLLLGRPDLDYNVSNVWRGEKRRPKILHLQPSMSSKDVERFITKGVTERVTLLQKMRPASAKRLKREIIKTLRDSSDGMFMLAKLMLAELKDMNKPELIREALSKPPRGLDDMFRRVIARLGAIGGFDKKDLNEIIMWVACAQRDLLLGELDLVLKLRDLRQNGIVAIEDELRTRFGSFFTVMSLQDGSEDEDAAAEDAVSTTASETTLLDNISDEDTVLEDYSDIGSDDDDDATGGASEALSDDEEEDDEIPWNFLSATVKFSHASVGQHFRNAPVHQEIGMDMNFAQAHITLTCLKFLTDNIPKRKGREWRDPTLFEYAVNHFLDHFVEVDIEQLKTDHADIFQTLSQEVMFLLNDRISIQRWFDALSNEYRFMHQFFTPATFVRLRTCGQVLATNKTSTVEEAGPKNTTDPKILLAPFAKYVVEAWLKFETCGKMMAILFLQAYLSLEDDPNCHRWSFPPNRPFEHIAESISPAEIREMSSLGSLPKDTTFYLSLGRTFAKIRTQQHRLAAVDEFEHAVQVSDDSTSTWDVYCSKAEVLCAIEKFEESIAAASLALEHLPAYRSYMKRHPADNFERLPFLRER